MRRELEENERKEENGKRIPKQARELFLPGLRMTEEGGIKILVKIWSDPPN